MNDRQNVMSVVDIFNQAVEFESHEQRNEFLDRIFEHRPEIREEIESLIRSHWAAGNFLSKPLSTVGTSETTDPGLTSPDLANLPHEIGPYRLIQQLGQGGMGTVYLAEQSHPVRRQVAVKLIKPGMDSNRVLKRFDAERQALALMQHDNIAKVFDAGTTPSGHPFFVMELIKGIPITKYCRERELTLTERLGLLIPVCHAVHHAHHKGIIHRDIKPSNVLISIQDGEAVPKVIDFGVAKAIHEGLTPETMQTEMGSIVGTLEYMSPEQTEMNAFDIDTRADVYSLGALLYELLTDSTPLVQPELKQRDLLTLLTTIREVIPQIPSVRVLQSEKSGTMSLRRPKSESLKRSRDLSGDLDWIVMKCLEKDRSRRYDSAKQLADDLERFLRHEPVLARAPSIGYRMTKFYQRRKSAVHAAAVILGLLTILAIVGRQYLRSSAEAARQKVESEHILAKNKALEQFDEIQRLIDRREFEPALDRLRQMEPLVADHPRFAPLLSGCSELFTLSSNPPGALISRRNYADGDTSWNPVARTESMEKQVRFAKGEYLWKASKEGFREVIGLRSPPQVHFDLDLPDDLPEEMVRVPAGRMQPTSFWFMYRFVNFDLPSFFIDRYEVSNAEFSKFVQANGYERSEYWRDLEFIDPDGKPLTASQAIAQFVDTTGEPGPATWIHGDFPDSQAEAPVMGVSWYEAMAYARFMKKSLPSVFHWERAVQHEAAAWLTRGQILDRFQFGEVPVDKNQLTDLGMFGTLGTGGNAKEWTSNATDQGNRILLGGGCGETLYMVITPDGQKPMSRNVNVGFRCMRSLDECPPLASQVIESVPWAPPPKPEVLLDRKTYDLSIADRFAYDHSQPLHASQTEQDEEHWKHVIAEIDCAYKSNNGTTARMEVHLYVPKGPRPQHGFQTVLYLPAGDGLLLGSPRPLKNEYGLDRILNSGRAVCRPVIYQTYQRAADPSVDPEQKQIMSVRDIQRAVDWISRCEELDPNKIAFYGFSWGAIQGIPALAIDSRFQAAIFQGVGLPIDPISDRLVFREPMHSVPHITMPVLMIGGTDDLLRPISSSQRPMLALLGSQDKELYVATGGHMLPNDVVMDKLLDWLNDRFGDSGAR